ncbi:MAG: virulence RhuM family protein [Lachnospiraceae bacterium]|nr:virulence RhuM family protein [Lachnospiraceae bacterium]
MDSQGLDFYFLFQNQQLLQNLQQLLLSGKTYQIEYHNLDVIISVGYRVKSLRGTQVRIWASGILKEYMKKGDGRPSPSYIFMHTAA